MNKDIIYIDTEDDITAIIGKIKSSKQKIVALVPPKRIGVLQSAVNLRLLARSAEVSGKHLVIVTNNKSLTTLSSMASIPVAKNLQSKPEIAEIAALDIDDGDDIIDGSQLPYSNTLKKKKDPEALEFEADKIDEKNTFKSKVQVKKPIPVIDNSISAELADEVKKKDQKIPDFNRFRKKMFIGGVIFVGLVAFLVWANTYAPYAKVIITAKTTDEPVSLAVKLGGSSATDVNRNIIQTISKQATKDVSVEFEATGKKDVGEKASGTITIENCDSSSSIAIAAGTNFISTSGKSFTSSSAVVVPGFSGSASACRADGTGAGSVTVKVTAIGSGESYNISATDYVISGVGGDVYAHGTDMAGGTTKNVAVVTGSDVEKATESLSTGASSDEIKKQLSSQFSNGESVILDSFIVTPGSPVSSPAVGEEVSSGKAKLTVKNTYSMVGIAKSEIQLFLKNVLNKQISENDNQRIYSDGSDSVKLSGYGNDGGSSSINITAVGKIGPNIDESKVKEQVKGLSYGDVQAFLGKVKGVSDVDTKFSFFWVTSVPNDSKKIDIEFKIQDEQK